MFENARMDVLKVHQKIIFQALATHRHADGASEWKRLSSTNHIWSFTAKQPYSNNWSRSENKKRKDATCRRACALTFLRSFLVVLFAWRTKAILTCIFHYYVAFFWPNNWSHNEKKKRLINHGTNHRLQVKFIKMLHKIQLRRFKKHTETPPLSQVKTQTQHRLNYPETLWYTGQLWQWPMSSLSD